MNPVIYVFINKSLGMSAGKLAAQAAHAVAMIPAEYSNDWISSPHRTILIMEARDENHIQNIEVYLSQRNVACYKIIDEGVNEIDPHVITAMATQVLNKDDTHTSMTMSTFKLYRDTIRIKLEVDR